jgi:hypothetical protein
VASGGSLGTIRLANLSDPDQFWEVAVHDGTSAATGAVLGVCVSRDDGFVLSVGRDGAFFVHRVGPLAMHSALQVPPPHLDAGRVDLSLGGPALASAMGLGPLAPDRDAATDITDPDAYSIEQAKLKLEHDRKLHTASLKKMSVRDALAEIRSRFADLRTAVAATPAGPSRLPESAMAANPALEARLRTRNAERAKQTARELAWHRARAQALLAKWRRGYGILGYDGNGDTDNGNDGNNGNNGGVGVGVGVGENDTEQAHTAALLGNAGEKALSATGGTRKGGNGNLVDNDDDGDDADDQASVVANIGHTVAAVARAEAVTLRAIGARHCVRTFRVGAPPAGLTAVAIAGAAAAAAEDAANAEDVTGGDRSADGDVDGNGNTGTGQQERGADGNQGGKSAGKSRGGLGSAAPASKADAMRQRRARRREQVA